LLKPLNKPFSKGSVTEQSLQHSIKDRVAFSMMAGVGRKPFFCLGCVFKSNNPAGRPAGAADPWSGMVIP
jgi:hypothetical protein